MVNLIGTPPGARSSTLRSFTVCVSTPGILLHAFTNFVDFETTNKNNKQQKGGTKKKKKKGEKKKKSSVSSSKKK